MKLKDKLYLGRKEEVMEDTETSIFAYDQEHKSGEEPSTVNQADENPITTQQIEAEKKKDSGS